jgi:hypothetical protein
MGDRSSETHATASLVLPGPSSDDLDRIYLYNDGCVPTRSPDAMAAYLEKLQILASLRVEWPASRSHAVTTKKLLVAGRPCREESLDSLRSALASAAGAD